MYVLCGQSACASLDSESFRLVHEYQAFRLLDYHGPRKALKQIQHQVTDGLPLWVNGNRVNVPLGRFEFQGHPRTLLRFAGPLVRDWLVTLRRRGVRVHFFCPPYGLCAELPANRRQVMAELRDALPVLLAASPYLAEHCRRHEASPSRTVSRQAGVAGDWIDLVFFRREDRQRWQRKFSRQGRQVIAHSDYKLRLVHGESLDELRQLEGVKLAGHARPAIPAAATASALLESVGLETGSEPQAGLSGGLDGHGQIIAVADTGLDQGSLDDSLHPDFRGRVRHVSSWPINESWAPFVKQPGHDDGAADTNTGHGTHVAGLALGSGAASGGRYRGVAPAAELVFQAIEQYTEIDRRWRDEIGSGYYLSGKPLDLRELFGEARELGARIHVNAWGDPARGGYTDDCYETDDYLFKHPDALVLFAAGNDGADRDGNRRIDRASVYAPASAKNSVAIGATEGPRQGVGLRVNWGAFTDRGRRRFANRLDREDAISGEPEHIALISSAGPTMDGRIKPDLCAPGTNLAAPRSQATAARGWGLASPLPFYMYYGGTSMACGVAGGFFAVLRQAWQEHLGGIAPSGMALKALAVLGADTVLRRDSDEPEPRQVAGFGRLDLAAALPGVDNRIRLVDHREPGLASGEMHDYPLRINRTQDFQATLCWYDAPGELLVNDLDLCLLDEAGVRHWGNHDAGDTGTPDRRNTVETITVNALAPGRYTLRVIGANVPVAPQSYALVYKLPLGGGPDLPLDWLRGIGPTYARRLQEAGIGNFASLMGLSLEELGEILHRRGRTVARIRSRLILLEERLDLRLPAEAPMDLRLAQLGEARPADMAEILWQRLNDQLLPLLEVFDRRVHKRIRLADLF